MTTKKKAKPFSSLSKAEKRIAIAKDVIAQIKAKKLIAESGTYCELEDSIDCNVGDSLQKLLRKEKPVCKVCGIGAAFIGAVRKFNKFNVDNDYIQTIDDDIMRETLRKYFSSEQLSLIENAFEKGTGYTDNGIKASESQVRRAQSFGYDYDEDDERLIAIMNRIAKNKRGLLEF